MRLKAKHFTQRPVVFLSIFEHNANLLPWRESGAKIVLVPMSEDGDFDFEEFERLLVQYKDYNSLKCGSFSAGSNITGIMFDVDRIAMLCHKYGCLAFFDYAAIAPYASINMNGRTTSPACRYQMNAEESALAYKDALFISPHKFVGGPGSSGVLITKKAIFNTKKPHYFGGGIVLYVNEMDHDFVTDVEDLEEAGTPGILSDIKAGLAFQLKEQISEATITEKEEYVLKRVMARFETMHNVFLIGNNYLPKVGIFSFMVSAKGKFLHPNFVCGILNDMFGIQSRSGCSCAAMYGQKLLGIDLTLSRRLKEAMFEGHEIFRMGYVRVNFNYFFSNEMIDYILDAIEFVSRFGWMLLPNYQLIEETGVWVCRDQKEKDVRTWLGEIDYSSGKMSYEAHATSFHKAGAPDCAAVLAEGKENLVKTVENYKNLYGKSWIDQQMLVPDRFKPLGWWIFPSDVL